VKKQQAFDLKDERSTTFMILSMKLKVPPANWKGKPNKNPLEVLCIIIEEREVVKRS
jgi:hypothetical protein